MKLLDQLAALRIVPVVVIDREEDAEPLADALLAGGIPCLEITLRTPAALGALARLKGRSDLLVGAGTVTTLQQARDALERGVQFMVSPGLAPKVIEYCHVNQLPVIPGVATPTEIQTALDYNLRLLKFFPAEALGGPTLLKALCGPYPQLQFMPTGGITPETLASYLAIPQVVACGGSWLVNPQWIRAGNFAAVTQAAKEAVALARSARAS